MIAYVFIVIAFLSVFLVYIFYQSRYTQHINSNKNSQKVYFMTYSETADFLLMDIDRYVQNMSEIDLFARKVSSEEEYRKSIADLTLSFQESDKQRLLKCSDEADLFFSTFAFYKEESPYRLINGKDLANVQWVFALTHRLNDKEYEESLPHTRSNIIFLSQNVLKYEDTDLINTLIHEKIHVYQRYNSQLFQKIVTDMGYLAVDKKKLPYKRFIRANPDTNYIVYYDIKTNKEMVCLYRSDKPTGINDIFINNFSLEHPYEKIAYDIANQYYSKIAQKYIDI